MRAAVIVQSSKDYQDYLRSPQWQVLAKAIKDKAYWSCQIYSSGNCRLEVHHKAYDNLGTKKECDDLVAVCIGCHNLIHELILS